MALAGDHDDVPWPCLAEGEGDRTAAITLDPVVGTGGDPGADLGDHDRRVFASRVVRGQHDKVGQLACDRAHRRALATVAIAATAKDQQDPPVSSLARHGSWRI